MVRVRQMVPDDMKRVAELAGQLGYPSTVGQLEKRFRALDGAPDSALFVAETAEGVVVGWAHVISRVLIESDPFAELMGLVVDASARRHGVGESLMNSVEGWAAAHGYRSIRIRSNSARTEARPFYEKMGYTVRKTQWVFGREI